MALPAFGLLVAAVLTFALAALATVLMVQVMNSLGGLPVIGSRLASFARTVSQAITHVCGQVFGGVEHAVGGAFHTMAAFLNRTWHLISETPAVVAHIAKVVGDGLYRVTGLRALVHAALKLVHIVVHRMHTLTRELHGIEHGLRTLERDLSKGIGEDVLPRIRSLDRELARLRHKVIPKVRAIAEGAEADAQAALNAVGRIPFPTGVKTWAEAIAAGLTALGLGWLRCDANPFNRNPAACGLWGDLADILALVVALEVALDFEQLVHEAQDVAELTATAIMDVFGLSAG